MTMSGSVSTWKSAAISPRALPCRVTWLRSRATTVTPPAKTCETSYAPCASAVKKPVPAGSRRFGKPDSCTVNCANASGAGTPPVTSTTRPRTVPCAFMTTVRSSVCPGPVMTPSARPTRSTLPTSAAAVTDTAPRGTSSYRNAPWPSVRWTCGRRPLARNVDVRVRHGRDAVHADDVSRHGGRRVEDDVEVDHLSGIVDRAVEGPVAVQRVDGRQREAADGEDEREAAVRVRRRLDRVSGERPDRRVRHTPSAGT